jgi:hypothetical protein
MMKQNKKPAVFLAGICMALLTAFWAVTLGHAEVDSPEEVLITAERSDTVEGEWVIALSHGLYGLVGDRDMAVLLTVEAFEGYTVEAVGLGYGADGLTLTVGETSRRAVSVLLDGRVQEGNNREILRVTLGKSHENSLLRGGYVGVTGGAYGEMALYVREGDGAVKLISLVFAGRDGEESGELTGEEMTEQSGEEVSEGIETDGAEAGETEGTVTVDESEEIEKEPYPTAVFMGCRETVVKNGEFTAQFLFYGEGGDTPVVCFGGGEVISLEIWRREDGWSFCTFRGLDGEKHYEFRVCTEKEWISVIYDRGIFRGFVS